MSKTPNLKKFQGFKFGMFVHWGLYSMMGDDCWHVMTDRNISYDEYIEKTVPNFTGCDCNTDEWAELAKKVGMRYMVFTTRHHDGFSMFDSKHSWGNYTSMNSPAKRDFVREFVDSCNKYGLGVGLYYSPIDWRFPGFYYPKMFKKNAEEMVTQCHKQVEELVTNYGKVDVLWYDGGEDFILCHGYDINSFCKPADYKTNPRYPNFWRDAELDAIVREKQPEIIVSPRFGTTKCGDFKVYECSINNYDTDSPWETCDRIANCWGWTPEIQPKSLRTLIQLLIRVITGGGNLLLNMGPNGNGKMEPEQVKRLLQLGDFVNKYSETIFETEAGPIVNGDYGGTTHNQKSVFLHVTDWKCDEVPFPTLNEKVNKVECLTAKDFTYREENGILSMNVSDADKCYYDTIFKITFEKDVDEVFKGFDPHSFKIDSPDIDRFCEIEGRE